MGQSASSESGPPAVQARPTNHPVTPSGSSAAECPIDHKSREAWLKAAQRQQPTTAGDGTPGTSQPIRPRMANSRLSGHREVSTIPRGFVDPDPASAAPPPSAATPAETPSSTRASHGMSASPPSSPNAQSADPHTSASGTWIYPSEEMFFNAMKRKSYNPQEKDMSSIIPIHNAVNERTWKEIQRWEKPYNDTVSNNTNVGGAAGRTSKGLCNGPKLVSFAGDSTKLTPRARWNVLLGYEKPFDRHDWVVDRCGTRIEYVIDYYQGKQGQGKSSLGPSFYLDVRPKLNSWEGVKMRVLKSLGVDGA